MKRSDKLVQMIYEEVKSNRSEKQRGVEVTKEQVEAVYRAAIKTLTRLIVDDGGVEVPMFGQFERTLSDPYIGNDPETHAPIKVPEKFKVSFRASKPLKDRIRTLDTKQAHLAKDLLAKPSRRKKQRLDDHAVADEKPV